MTSTEVNAPSLPARFLAGMAEFMRSRGLSFDELAREVGLDPQSVKNSDAELEFAAVTALFELGARRSGDDAFGLDYALTDPVAPVGIFHYIMVNSPTVRDALAARIRYTRLITNAYRVDLVKADGVEMCRWDFGSASMARAQFTDFAVTILVERIRIMIGRPAWVPSWLELDHRKPRAVAAFHRALGTNLRFNREHVCMALDAATLGHVIRGADATLSRELEAIVHKCFNLDDNANTILDRVRQQIARQLPTGKVTVESVARGLSISPRSLQRRLSAAGLPFREQLEETRKSTAHRLLVETDLPLTEVAYLLGFSELSAFSRAARSWFGRRASEVRRSGRSD